MPAVWRNHMWLDSESGSIRRRTILVPLHVPYVKMVTEELAETAQAQQILPFPITILRRHAIKNLAYQHLVSMLRPYSMESGGGLAKITRKLTLQEHTHPIGGHIASKIFPVYVSLRRRESFCLQKVLPAGPHKNFLVETLHWHWSPKHNH